MPLTALITRPEEDARPLAEALAGRGVAVVIEPLLAIRPLPEAATDLAKDLDGVQALLFTSANGARAFAALSSRRDIGVLAVGEATAAAARGLGFAAVESAGGDVQALAGLARQRLKPGNGPLFHAAGSAVAGDLAGLLAADGFELRRRVLYESATAEALSPEALAALKSGRIDLVLLFSPRTAATFAALARAAGIDARSMTALCLSAGVGEAVRSLGWRAVEVAAKPDLPALLDLVDRAIPAAPTPAKAPPAMPQDSKTPAPGSSSPKSSAPPAASPVSTAAPTPIPTVAPALRGSNANGGGGRVFLAGLLGAVIAAVAVLGLLRFAPGVLGLAPVVSGGAPAASGPDLAPRLAELGQRLDALQAKIESLPKPAADLGDLPARLADLQQQVAALKEAAPATGALPAELTALPQRLKDLEQRLAALEQKPDAAADLAALKQDVAKLQAASGTDATSAAGLVLGLVELRARLAAGFAFTPQLDALSTLAAADPALKDATSAPLAALKPIAGSGAPSLTQLQAEFPAAAEAITRADRNGAGALPPDASLTDRVLARIESLVTIRPVAEGGEQAEGNSPLARLARAEAKLGRGDLAGAVAELSALTGPPRDAAALWLDRAQARLAAEAASANLADAILARLAGKAAQ